MLRSEHKHKGKVIMIINYCICTNADFVIGH